MLFKENYTLRIVREGPWSNPRDLESCIDCNVDSSNKSSTNAPCGHAPGNILSKSNICYNCTSARASWKPHKFGNIQIVGLETWKQLITWVCQSWLKLDPARLICVSQPSSDDESFKINKVGIVNALQSQWQAVMYICCFVFVWGLCFVWNGDSPMVLLEQFKH